MPTKITERAVFSQDCYAQIPRGQRARNLQGRYHVAMATAASQKMSTKEIFLASMAALIMGGGIANASSCLVSSRDLRGLSYDSCSSNSQDCTPKLLCWTTLPGDQSDKMLNVGYECIQSDGTVHMEHRIMKGNIPFKQAAENGCCIMTVAKGS